MPQGPVYTRSTGQYVLLHESSRQPRRSGPTPAPRDPTHNASACHVLSAHTIESAVPSDQWMSKIQTVPASEPVTILSSS